MIRTEDRDRMLEELKAGVAARRYVVDARAVAEAILGRLAVPPPADRAAD